MHAWKALACFLRGGTPPPCVAHRASPKSSYTCRLLRTRSSMPLRALPATSWAPSLEAHRWAAGAWEPKRREPCPRLPGPRSPQAAAARPPAYPSAMLPPARPPPRPPARPAAMLPLACFHVSSAHMLRRLMQIKASSANPTQQCLNWVWITVSRGKQEPQHKRAPAVLQSRARGGVLPCTCHQLGPSPSLHAPAAQVLFGQYQGRTGWVNEDAFYGSMSAAPWAPFIHAGPVPAAGFLTWLDSAHAQLVYLPCPVGGPWAHAAAAAGAPAGTSPTPAA